MNMGRKRIASFGVYLLYAVVAMAGEGDQPEIYYRNDFETKCDLVFWTNAIFRNCLIANNNHYGIKVLQAPAPIIDSCVIVSNQVGGLISGTGTGTNINCIIYYNGPNGTNNFSGSANSSNLLYSCVGPGPTNGTVGIVTNEPLFVDMAAGNYHLSANSPCVNAGSNQDWMSNSVDLDDRQRIRYGIVDMGAYEVIYNGTIYTIP